MDVRTVIHGGRTHHRRVDDELYKDPDKKFAYVKLRREARSTIVALTMYCWLQLNFTPLEGSSGEYMFFTTLVLL